MGRTGERPGGPLRVAITRPVESAGLLAELLRAGGAEPVVLPLTRIGPPPDTGPLQHALSRLPQYDWIVFTSENGVRAVAEALGPIDADARPRAVAAVGSATAAAVTARLGWPVTVVPDEFTGDALVPAMAQHGLAPGAAVLWPRAEQAREAVQAALAARGARLDAPVAYRTLPEPANADRLARLAERGEIDAIIFTAPSAVHCYAAVAPRGAVLHAVIGPTTADAARMHGLAVHVQPREATIPALVRSLFARLTRD